MNVAENEHKHHRKNENDNGDGPANEHEPVANSVMLDASSFPRIIDLIPDHLYLDSPVDYLAAQGVCRTWQRHIKERLFTHLIIITTTDKPDEYRVSTHPPAVFLRPEARTIPADMKAILPWIRVLDVKGVLPVFLRGCISHHANGVEIARSVTTTTEGALVKSGGGTWTRV